jgi:hypothetical protein
MTERTRIVILYILATIAGLAFLGGVIAILEAYR